MYGIRSALFKYSVTTFEPGARLVFTQGFTCKPRRTALRASRPAAISTDGLEVLVQLGMFGCEQHGLAALRQPARDIVLAEMRGLAFVLLYQRLPERFTHLR